MKDYFGYNGKNCVITGASSGMGRATAEMLVDLGANVYALDINPCPVEGITEYYQCNLTDKASIDSVFTKLPSHIDCFFGVAGLSGAKTDYRTTFNCNYTANVHITNEYLKNRMSAGGSIVYVTSIAGLEWKKFKKEQNKVVKLKTWEEIDRAIDRLAEKAHPTFAYMYSKRCMSHYACKTAIELGKVGIRVNNVLPCSTDTGMKKEFEDMMGSPEGLIKQAGLAGRLASSDEMGMPIVFLNSDMASFVSGIDLCVDMADTSMKILGIKKNIESVSATNPLILSLAKIMMKRSANK